MLTGSLGTVSNRETWEQAADVVDEDGDDVTITGATITLALRREGKTSPDITLTNSSGITIATPRFTWLFTVTQMRTLCPGKYELGCTILLNGTTTQLIIGTVGVVDGVVS